LGEVGEENRWHIAHFVSARGADGLSKVIGGARMRKTRIIQNTGDLTVPQRRAVEALASGATKQQAATIAGRTERTINKWLADFPVFADALRRASDMTVDNASRRLGAILDDAIDVIVEIMGDGDTSPHVRLRAAELAIGNLIKLREFGDLADRVTELEERLA
jgi:hypothetical protein